MGTCLMIGNGLNQCVKQEAWNKLLDELAQNRNISRDGSTLPFPLEFERIMNNYLANASLKNKSDAYTRAKKSIAKKISRIILPSGCVHYDLKKIKPDSIITTNYDFLLEQVYGVKNPSLNCRKKQTYISGCTSDEKGVKFYHPHGVVSNPTTICLGYMHYAKIIADLQKSIARKIKNVNREVMVLKHCRGEITLDHWATKFYDSDVAFIGFGLDYSELDIWWILAHRATLMNVQTGGVYNNIKNTVVYYDTVTPEIIQRKKGEELTEYVRRQIDADKKNEAKRQKHKLLESMNVVVKTITLNSPEPNEYIKAYTDIIDDIATNGIH